MIKNPSQFLLGEQHFLIEGPQGDLELLTLSAPQARGVAIVCHPHPLFQGTMHNKVVHTLAQAFHRQGLHSVRFNYRGVGKSEGQFGHSVGEGEDLQAVINWVQSVVDLPLWLAGFSFGAFIAAFAAQHTPCQQLYSVAPAVANQPYGELTINCPWVVIQGDADEVSKPGLVYEWFEKHQRASMQLIKLPGVSHFFHGNLIVLRDLVEQTLL